MEKIQYEDGFNVVTLQCDGCGKEIPQAEKADSPWFEVTIEPLARDQWNAGDSLGEYHFCSSDCFKQKADTLDPSAQLRSRSGESADSETRSP